MSTISSSLALGTLLSDSKEKIPRKVAKTTRVKAEQTAPDQDNGGNMARVVDQDGTEVIEESQGQFVDPTKTHMLHLSNGKWVEIKKKLNYREKRHVETAGFKSVVRKDANDADQSIELGIDFEQMEIERLVTWIVDWNFADGKGRPLDVNRKNIENLDPDDAQLIIDALQEYVEEQERVKNSLRLTSKSDGD